MARVDALPFAQRSFDLALPNWKDKLNAQTLLKSYEGKLSEEMNSASRLLQDALMLVTPMMSHGESRGRLKESLEEREELLGNLQERLHDTRGEAGLKEQVMAMKLGLFQHMSSRVFPHPRPSFPSRFALHSTCLPIPLYSPPLEYTSITGCSQASAVLAQPQPNPVPSHATRW